MQSQSRQALFARVEAWLFERQFLAVKAGCPSEYHTSQHSARRILLFGLDVKFQVIGAEGDAWNREVTLH